MIRIEEVQLDITLPDNEIGMVIMQPFIELDISREPYRWQEDKKDKQIKRVVRTLEIARRVEHGCEKTHFIIFPEYSIPGIEGIDKIQEYIRNNSGRNGTIIIGGIDGLTKNEYFTLCDEDMIVQDENKAEKVQDEQWVNPCIIWVKQTNGSVKKWVQPKIVPSWPERNITCNDMFCGKSVYLFKCKFRNGVDCYFLTLICYDWIGQINSNEGIWAVLSEINDYWKDSDRKDIHFIFVLQNNDEPNHRDFIENARNYFENRSLYPFAVRDNSAILFVNTAGGPLPAKYQRYGYSSLVCSPNASFDTNGCPPTFAIRTNKLRGNDNLGRCKDAVFREMGACIHSFGFCTPSFINLGPSGRSLIINKAIVHAIDEETDNLRVPGKPVPASVKWINDHLDGISSVLHYVNNNPLKKEIEQKHEEISKEIRKCSDYFLCKSMEQAVCNYDKCIYLGERKIHDVDNWDDNEKRSLETVIYSLSIIKTSKSLEISNATAHAAIKSDTNVIDVIVVSGGKTNKECFDYGRQFLKSEQRFGIIITRDVHELPVNIRDKSIFETGEKNTEKGPIITDPNSRFIHCGYSNLKNICSNSTNLNNLRNNLTEIIGI